MRTKFVTFVFFLLALSALFSKKAVAATYYVDSVNGGDSNSGLTQAAAWKTIAKVNAANLSAGDSVLFVAGGVWHEC